MKRHTLILTIGLLLTLALSAQSTRQETPFDADWLFLLGDEPAASKPGFDDGAWRLLNLPHDWSIEGQYDINHPTGRGGGYLPAGIGWYRKAFTLPASIKDKQVFIEFDGVMANSEVWVNGQYLGKRPFGYVSFRYELTPHLKSAGQTNTVAVRVDNSDQPASRWYAGAGIYRHVRLVTMHPVHIDHWGVFITTPDVTVDKASVNIAVDVKNQTSKTTSVTVQTTVKGQDGSNFVSAPSTLTIKAGETKKANLNVAVDKPQLWDNDQPNLYTAVTSVKTGNNTVDEVSTPFGIRNVHFDAATGFYLNGVNKKILGVCLHLDGGPVGTAVPLAVWERRLTTLKSCGVNAIRVAHHPMDPGFYDLCDRMGFLVMNETFDTWTAAKPNGTRGYNLHFNEWWETDTRDVVLRDRNHPSIIMYSIGNEIRDRLDREDGQQRLLNQRDLVHKLDPTRPVTMALFRPNEMKVYDNGVAEMLDIVGQNYRESELVAAWKAKPDRKVIGTENRHDNETWLILRDNPFMSGQFLWTGIDYLGEANWPEISRNVALLDRNGYIKPLGYERQSWWSCTPMVKVVRSEDNGGRGPLKMDWTPADFGAYDEAHLFVYSNCDEVEIVLNGESKGRQTIHQDATPRFWNIEFEPGVLKAIGYNKGAIVAVDELVTADRGVKLELKAERTTVKNDWDDLVYVTASIVDQAGRVNPTINPSIKVTVSGAGSLVGLDNSSILSHEPYKTNVRTAVDGKVVALIQAKADKGEIIITAEAEGYPSTSLKLEAIPATR
jgi:beta-galactosidase